MLTSGCWQVRRISTGRYRDYSNVFLLPFCSVGKFILKLEMKACILEQVSCLQKFFQGQGQNIILEGKSP